MSEVIRFREVKMEGGWQLIIKEAAIAERRMNFEVFILF